MSIKNIVQGQRVTKEKLQRAKELRRDMTPAEKILWEELRANKLGVFAPLCPLDISPKCDKENYFCRFGLRQRRICPQGATQGETRRCKFSSCACVQLCI